MKIDRDKKKKTPKKQLCFNIYFLPIKDNLYKAVDCTRSHTQVFQGIFKRLKREHTHIGSRTIAPRTIAPLG
jgi:hypothetical protein